MNRSAVAETAPAKAQLQEEEDSELQASAQSELHDYVRPKNVGKLTGSAFYQQHTPVPKHKLSRKQPASLKYSAAGSMMKASATSPRRKVKAFRVMNVQSATKATEDAKRTLEDKSRQLLTRKRVKVA